MNLIENAKLQIHEFVRAAYTRAADSELLPAGAELKGIVEIPKDVNNGDYAANHAMAAAKVLRSAPRKIAETLVANMELEEIIRLSLKRLM